MTTLTVEGLRLTTRIGVTDEERSAPQVVLVNVYIEADLSQAEQSDDFSATIDYDTLCGDIAALVEATECRLLEHLGAKIADRIAALPRVETVTVEVAKEEPPVKQEVGHIGVTVQRTGTA